LGVDGETSLRDMIETMITEYILKGTAIPQCWYRIDWIPSPLGVDGETSLPWDIGYELIMIAYW